MRTRIIAPMLVLWTLSSISCAQTASPLGQALLSTAVAVPEQGSAVPQISKEVQNIGGIPFGEGSGIYDPYEHRILGKQRWEKDSFLQFLYHTPGTRHEQPVVYGPLKEGC
ncbi:MAG: hypothetical protein KA175_16440 [Flavobacteriales bacterium]|nr:hypothetical protein [Flavobacteriales bacterium]MBP6699213.1 hypothetical protein [Flavobacteriales bacterium]